MQKGPLVPTGQRLIIRRSIHTEAYHLDAARTDAGPGCGDEREMVILKALISTQSAARTLFTTPVCSC